MTGFGFHHTAFNRTWLAAESCVQPQRSEATTCCPGHFFFIFFTFVAESRVACQKGLGLDNSHLLLFRKMLALHAAYEMMLAQKFVDFNGTLLPDAPT